MTDIPGAAALTEWTLEEIAEYLAIGFHGVEGHPFNVTQGGSITVNVTQLTPEGQVLALLALDLWSDVIGVSFTPVLTGAQITFDDLEIGAITDSMWSGGFMTSANVNVPVSWVDFYGAAIGEYAFQTYLHEVGHALGLGHPADYGLAPTYLTHAQFANDGWPTTVMSYFAQDEPGSYFDNLGFSFAIVATPMIADIAAMELLYGLSTTTRTGNTTYGFNSTAGRDSFNASLHPEVAYAIFDSGGIDTLDYSGFSDNQMINLEPASFSNVGGLVGNVAIASGTIIENAIGGSGADVLLGNSAANTLSGGGGVDLLYGLSGNDQLNGGAGADVLEGGLGADSLTGGAGGDSFRGSAAALNGDTINDLSTDDRIVFTDASLASFSFSVSSSTLTYSGGSLTLAGGVEGQLVASAVTGGGVQLTLSTEPPPPPLPTMAKLLLTQPGQDFDIGGDVMIIGTTGGGEEVRVIRGDIMLDASFNIGGDTVVLPGNAASYTAILSGSFVTISGGDISIAIPVGVNGLTVEFADAERSLRFDPGSGSVLLGSQAVTGTAVAVAAATTPFISDGPDIGPSSMAKLLLTEAGQDIDIGGNVTIVGTTSGGEVITVLGGTIMLDASFNVGGDTVALPGNAASYTATLAGSFVTIAGGDISIAIPVGTAGLTVDFADTDKTLRFDPGSGQVMLGDQPVTSSGGSIIAAEYGADKGGGVMHSLAIEPHDEVSPFAVALELHSFSFA